MIEVCASFSLQSKERQIPLIGQQMQVLKYDELFSGGAALSPLISPPCLF